MHINPGNPSSASRRRMLVPRYETSYSFAAAWVLCGIKMTHPNQGKFRATCLNRTPTSNFLLQKMAREVPAKGCTPVGPEVPKLKGNQTDSRS